MQEASAPPTLASLIGSMAKVSSAPETAASSDIETVLSRNKVRNTTDSDERRERHGAPLIPRHSSLPIDSARRRRLSRPPSRASRRKIAAGYSPRWDAGVRFFSPLCWPKRASLTLDRALFPPQIVERVLDEKRFFAAEVLNAELMKRTVSARYGGVRCRGLVALQQRGPSLTQCPVCVVFFLSPM